MLFMWLPTVMFKYHTIPNNTYTISRYLLLYICLFIKPTKERERNVTEKLPANQNFNSL